MTTVAVIQARTGSTPPGKVMYPLAGTPVLTHVVERVAAADAVGRTVVATSTEPPDEVIDTVGQRYGKIRPDKPEAEGRKEPDCSPVTSGARPEASTGERGAERPVSGPNTSATRSILAGENSTNFRPTV